MKAEDLGLQNLYRNSFSPQTLFTPTNISYASWKCKTLPLSGVQMKIGFASRPSISESSWTGLGSRHREQNFVGTKLSRCNCIGTRLHPDLMLLPFRCPVQTGNCSCLINQLICTVFCAGEGNWLCCNPYTENTDDDDDDDLHMFDYAEADFTGNWSLWRTSSMIWYHIKPHDTMKGPKILVKQCIKSLFFMKI